MTFPKIIVKNNLEQSKAHSVPYSQPFDFYRFNLYRHDHNFFSVNKTDTYQERFLVKGRRHTQPITQAPIRRLSRMNYLATPALSSRGQ
jgi:hypothetical protein